MTIFNLSCLKCQKKIIDLNLTTLCTHCAKYYCSENCVENERLECTIHYLQIADVEETIEKRKSLVEKYIASELYPTISNVPWARLQNKKLIVYLIKSSVYSKKSKVKFLNNEKLEKFKYHLSKEEYEDIKRKANLYFKCKSKDPNEVLMGLWIKEEKLHKLVKTKF